MFANVFLGGFESVLLILFLAEVTEIVCQKKLGSLQAFDNKCSD